MRLPFLIFFEARQVRIVGAQGSSPALPTFLFPQPQNPIPTAPRSDAWLAFLRLELPDDTYRRVLTRLHDAVLPAVFNPLLLSDFLTYSLDKGGCWLAGQDWVGRGSFTAAKAVL